MKTIAQSGTKKAQLVLGIAENYDKFLSTVLIGNNIVNLSLSSLGTVFFLKHFPSVGALVSTVIITVVVLTFGEIFPKSAAREKADSLVLSIVYPIRAIAVVLSPLVFVFSKLRLIFRRKNNDEDDPFGMTEEELITFVEEVEQDGGINQEESDLIRSAIEFTDVSAEDILTPRVDVAAIGLDLDMEEIAKTFISCGYSRLPVYDEDIDDVIGILHEKDFFMAYYKGIEDIREVLQKPVFISGHVKISALLQVLKNAKCHMAVVVDEFGGMTGIVTMEDIIEELIGDVWDEHDEIIEPFTEEEDGSCLVDCSASIDDLFERYDISVDPEKEDDLPQTVNGWLLMEFGNFPDLGEKFEYAGYLFEVTKITQKKIEEVRVSKIKAADAPSSSPNGNG
jgi:CBS domain containing-hemolysin-like protein